MNYPQIANALSEGLGLAHPPIGLAFVEEPPAGIPRYAAAAPAACAFWKAAQTSLFYATAEDHYNCPIGTITQGFNPPEEVLQRGMALIGEMGKIQYFKAAEVGNVPTVKKRHSAIVYGPLSRFGAVTPDLALILCTPFQAMLLSEAAGAVEWRGAGKESHIFGRPACAVIPSALKDTATSASLACIGARTFAGIAESEMIVAVPAEGLAKLEEGSPAILRANAEMRKFYQSHKSRFAAVV